jgi:phosphoribosylaminoimidazole-succinocarboxamide synthase
MNFVAICRLIARGSVTKRLEMKEGENHGRTHRR